MAGGRAAEGVFSTGLICAKPVAGQLSAPASKSVVNLGIGFISFKPTSRNLSP
jgi:hypothetical protein